MTATIEADAETELELVEGLRVLGRITALCSELSLDVDPQAAVVLRDEHRSAPHRRRESRRRVPARDDRRSSPLPRPRQPGHDRVPRLPSARGHRASTPRRMAAYVSDRDLTSRADGTFAFVLAAKEPTAEELRRRHVGRDSRRRVGDRSCASTSGIAPTEIAADITIEPLDPPRLPPLPTDAVHRRAAHEHGVDDREAHDVAPHDQARAARDAERARDRGGRAARRGRHHARQPLHDRHVPARARRGARRSRSNRRTPATGASRSRTSGTSASIPRRRRSSITNAAAVPGCRRPGADRRRRRRIRASTTGSTPAVGIAAS